MPKEKPMLNASSFFLILWQNAKGKADAQRIDFPIGKIKILLLREKLIK
jgi:hypothetical protein